MILMKLVKGVFLKQINPRTPFGAASGVTLGSGSRCTSLPAPWQGLPGACFLSFLPAGVTLFWFQLHVQSWRKFLAFSRHTETILAYNFGFKKI